MAGEDKRIDLSDFEKVKLEGEGASGAVWLARVKRDLPFAKTGQEVALKVYKSDILDEPGQRKRIAEEYETGSRLVHPNLVKIYHFDIEHDPPFTIMEWCSGQNLFEWRKCNEPDETFLLQLATQLLDALEFLHSSRRQHRDVKPTNVHVDQKGRIRLLDYGIIRSLRVSRITQDPAARFVGTYRYSAPEYIFDDQYSYAADLYSFGAVIYYMLHGREIFSNAVRTPDMIQAKKAHKIFFETRLSENGSIWAALLELAQNLLTPEVTSRVPSALASLELLGKALPDEIPLRSYFACALTRVGKESEQRTQEVTLAIREAVESNGFVMYAPGEHTHPSGAPNLSAAEVYWIDRERVASSDLLIIHADEPSFGVGQEAEIAANAGVPIVIFHSKGLNISRMLRGIAGRVMLQIEFSDVIDLQKKANAFFKENKSRLRLSRKSREREYNLRLGNRIRDARRSVGLSTKQLEDRSSVNKELIEALESRPEQQANISLINLRRLARALSMSPAELLKDQGSKDQEFEDLFRSSLATLREYALEKQLGYKTYTDLKHKGRETLRSQVYSLAARGDSVRILDLEYWKRVHKELLDS